MSASAMTIFRLEESIPEIEKGGFGTFGDDSVAKESQFVDPRGYGSAHPIGHP